MKSLEVRKETFKLGCTYHCQLFDEGNISELCPKLEISRTCMQIKEEDKGNNIEAKEEQIIYLF